MTRVIRNNPSVCRRRSGVMIPSTDVAIVKELPVSDERFIHVRLLEHIGKINDGVLAVWAELPAWRSAIAFVINGTKADMPGSLSWRASKRQGIDEMRVVFASRQTHKQYLADV